MNINQQLTKSELIKGSKKSYLKTKKYPTSKKTKTKNKKQKQKKPRCNMAQSLAVHSTATRWMKSSGVLTNPVHLVL